MTGKPKDPNRVYDKNWGGRRMGAGTAKGRNVGHNGGRKPPEEPKKQRNVYVTDAEFEMIKDYLWNVLRKGQSQANRKHKVSKPQANGEE